MNKKKITILAVFVLTFIVSSAVFSDWEHFKDGLLGRESRSEQCGKY